jgi:hypothetical protein
MLAYAVVQNVVSPKLVDQYTFLAVARMAVFILNAVHAVKITIIASITVHFPGS